MKRIKKNRNRTAIFSPVRNKKKKRRNGTWGLSCTRANSYTIKKKKATVVIGTIKSTERGEKKNVIHDNNITRILSSSLNARVNAATLHFCSFYLLTHDSKAKFIYFFSEHIYTGTYTHTHQPQLLRWKKKKKEEGERGEKQKKRKKDEDISPGS